MSKTALAAILELAELLGLAVGTGLFSWIGVRLERLGLTALFTGQIGVGLWLVVMGFLAFYVGLYLIGYDILLSRLFGRNQLVPGSR